MKWKPRSFAAKVIALAALVLTTVVVGLAPAASAAGTRSGDAAAINPSTNLVVPSGGSSTSFTLGLPATTTQALCTHDTATFGYHVYSFIVPAATDPGTLTFNPSTGPSSGFPLVDTTGSAYIAANTAAVTGQVINIPTFNFNLFATTSMGGTKLVLAPGDYKAGIACATSTGQGDKYWQTTFTFTANGGDPNGEVWTNQPDHAVVTTSGCKSSTTPGAEMGQYPAWPGSQSYLRIACIFKHSNGDARGDDVASTFTIHDFSNSVYHNGAARTVTASANVAAGLSAFPVSDCLATSAFINRGITGPGIAPRTFVTSIGGGCSVNLNKPLVAPGVSIGNTFLIENSSVRSVTDATLAAGAPMVTSATANFTAADVGLSFDGTNVTPGTTISAFVSATQVNLSTPPTAGAAQTVTIGGTLDGGSTPAASAVTSTRTFNDATSTTTTITSTAARFNVSDIGLKVAGPGITQPCYIASRTATVATLTSACATANGTPYTVTVGDPTRTAPVATDTVLNQGAQLSLNPAFVAGSQPCALDSPSGFGIEGTWLNPGSFVGGAFATQPPNTKAVGEILFSTSVVQYAAYVLEIPAGLGIDPLIGGYHFNVVFPNVPTSLALCPSTPTSRGTSLSIGINATTASQAAIPTGVGRPSTAQLRSTRFSTTGSTTTVFLTDDVNGAGVKWTGVGFNRTLIIPAGTPDINFVGGDG